MSDFEIYEAYFQMKSLISQLSFDQESLGGLVELIESFL